MDTTQDFNKTSETSPQTFEEFENKEAEAVFSSFFGDFTEEEQKILRDFGTKFNIRSNDAIWSVAGIFIIFGRINNKLPQRIKTAFAESKDDLIEFVKQTSAEMVGLETQKAMSNLSETLQQISKDIFNQHRKKTWLYDFLIPLAFACFGVFCLCLISFVGGAAVAGKGWGHSPADAILNAPAGWIIPLALIPVGGFALFQGLTEQGRGKYINLVVAVIIAILALCVLSHIL